MLSTSVEVYEYLKYLKFGVDVPVPLPATGTAVEDLVEYIDRLPEEIRKRIVLQSEFQEVIPPASEQQITQNLYQYLIKESSFQDKQNIPQPQLNEEVYAYQRRLNQIPQFQHINFEHIPRKVYEVDMDKWEDKEEKITQLAKKMKENDILLIQDRNGVLHQQALQNTYNELTTKIFNETEDLSLAQTLSEIVEIEVKRLQLDDGIKEAYSKIILKYLPLLSSDPAIFHDIVEFEIDNKFTGIDSYDKRHVLKTLNSNICIEFYFNGEFQLSEHDNALLDKFLPDHPKAGLGVEIKKTPNIKSDEKPDGVLITTSNGGGCHKEIANKVAASNSKEGIDTAIINESVMTRFDPLQRFTGIPRSDLYPVVAQQLGQLLCCNRLKDIDNEIRRHFVPPYEYAQLRKAAKLCGSEIKVKVVYSTQHYAHDIRILPENAKMIFQVCDFGIMGKLSNLSTLLSEVLEKINWANADDYKIKFLIPSETCLENAEKPDNKAIADNPDLFVQSVFPVNILDAQETNDHFRALVQKEDLFSPDEENVTRSAIVMGGQGCGDLIRAYMDKLRKDLQSSDQLGDNKIEVVVACGNNKQLQEQLKAEFSDLNSNSQCRIRFCGFIDNKQLIAYNKNGVLITKPGGGTIAESVENKIQTLVHYNPKFPWEYGNASEIKKQGLGKILVGENNDQGKIVTLDDIDLVGEIINANILRTKQINDAIESLIEEEVETLQQIAQLQIDIRAETDTAGIFDEISPVELTATVDQLQHLKKRTTLDSSLTSSASLISISEREELGELKKHDKLKDKKEIAEHIRKVKTFLTHFESTTSGTTSPKRRPSAEIIAEQVRKGKAAPST
jgi:hypothetical protein